MGEFWSLMPEERRKVDRIVCEESRGKAQVIAHTAHHNIREAVELSKHAIEVGAYVAQGQARMNVQEAGRIDTGFMYGAIDVVPVSPWRAEVRAGAEYSIYQEEGTGRFAPGGRVEPWTFFPDRLGHFVTTSGQPGIHFMRDALENKQSIIAAIEADLRDGLSRLVR